MSDESDRELEQLQKLDKLRKLIQTILGTHWILLVVVFALVLATVLSIVLVSVSYSSSRYLARLNLSYLPKQRGKINPYDEKYVLGILKRQTTRLSFFRHVEAKQGKGNDSKPGKGGKRKKPPVQQIVIAKDRKQPHNFSIQLNAASESAAVEMINEFARVCIQEYTKERTQDLRKWKAVLEKERKGISGKIRGCEDQIARLVLPFHVVTPEKEYERIRIQMSEFQTAKFRLNVALENLNIRKKQLEKELAAFNPAVMLYQQEIKAFQTELEKLDNEIFTASEIYTKENPKMIAILSRRNAVQKRLDSFLRSKGIKSTDSQSVATAEKLSAEQKELKNELEIKQNEMRVLEGEIANTQKRFKQLTELQPKLQQLNQILRTHQESLSRLDESISEINYMLLTVKDDLFINEKALSAVGSRPFSKKKLAICIFAAAAITCFAASVIVLLEFFFGYVANAHELMLYDEFQYLGVLPASEEMFKSQDREKMSFKKIFYNFQLSGLHVLFTGALPGAKIISPLFDFFELELALSGQRMLVVNMVLAEEFDEPPDPDSETMIVTFSGGKCYLPLASKKYLDPSELELLKNDFQSLKKNYDYIFIRHTFTMRRSILFLEQITEICDGMLIAVGAGKTPRKSLRKLLSTQLKIMLPVLTVLTDHSIKELTKDLNQEAES